jgi:putative addiction module component (TIGR02574 family)
MAASKDDIYRTALTLPKSDRVDLIDALLDSLDREIEEGVEEAWRAEIDRRARELESGAAESIPLEVVRDRLARAQRG